MITYADTGVVVVDAGFARLSYTYELNKNPDVQVAITEQSVSPSGGARLGGQLVSAMDPDPKPHMTSRQPTRKSGQPTRTQNKIFIENIYEKQLRNCNHQSSRSQNLNEGSNSMVSILHFAMDSNSRSQIKRISIFFLFFAISKFLSLPRDSNSVVSLEFSTFSVLFMLPNGATPNPQLP
nr:uncharacterized protein LOC114820820 [Malus domestica]